jgi:hypothetical protein
LMANHLEVFEITDPMHPAKRRTEDVLLWMDIRPIECGLRAKKVSRHLSSCLHFRPKRVICYNVLMGIQASFSVAQRTKASLLAREARKAMHL